MDNEKMKRDDKKDYSFIAWFLAVPFLVYISTKGVIQGKAFLHLIESEGLLGHLTNAIYILGTLYILFRFIELVMNIYGNNSYYFGLQEVFCSPFGISILLLISYIILDNIYIHLHEALDTAIIICLLVINVIFQIRIIKRLVEHQ